MKLISKEESKRLLGRKKGFFGQAMSIDSVPIFYIGGMSEIDDDLASRQIELKDQMTMFNAYPNGFEIEVYTLPTKTRLGTRTYRIPIMPNQILKWTIEKQDAVYEQQSKSVLGRAVIGGLLFGGAGAVVGALSGTKGKREKVNFIDYILTLIIDYNGNEKAIILGFPNAIIKDVRKFFDKSFPNTFLESDKFIIKMEKTSDSLSIADELQKFKDLLDNDVITQEEFEKQKTKLLSD